MKFTSDNAFIVSLAMLQVIYTVPIPCRIVQEYSMVRMASSNYPMVN